jgi:DNA-directed RNA polymerase alpha subunit
MTEEMFEIVKETEDLLHFVVRDTELCIVNALRRTILSDIPNVGVKFDPASPNNQDVFIHENTCPLHNEFIGHRISLLPIHATPEEVETLDWSAYKFVIDCKNTDLDILDVTTDDILVYENETLRQDLHKRWFPHDRVTDDPILITKLKPNVFYPANGNKIHLEFYASVSTAKKHASWSPVSICTFENVIDEDAAQRALELALEGQTNKKAITERFNTLEKYRYFKKNERNEANEFLFKVETVAGLKARYIVWKGLQCILDLIQSQIEACTTDWKVEKSPEQEELFQIEIEGQMHTFGSLIQAWLFDRCVREKCLLKYVGYYCPHPLVERVVLKLAPTDLNMTSDDILRLIQTELISLQKMVETMRERWTSI